MRLIFFGYHNIGYVCLKAFIEMCGRFSDDLAAVVTHADDPKENIWFASVRELAFKHHLPVYQPQNPNEPAFVQAMAKLAPDFIFSCYYRHMLKKPLLELPRLGALNLHGSLLPKYRGRVPVNWVLVNGETETGMTLHYMEEKADQGDIVAQHRVSITEDDTAYTLFAKMTVTAEELMYETYPLLRAGRAPRVPQNHTQASYFGGRKPQDGRIDWNKSAREIYNLVRAVTHPYPGAFTTLAGRKLFIWWGRPLAEPAPPGAAPGEVVSRLPGQGLIVATGDGMLLIIQAQWEGEPEFLGPVVASWQEMVGRRLE
ncbi:MAG: formyltransferase [Deltaproteobacteria bacterium]|nr:formyltransferase [Deltaproteobacteria bacterium]